MKKLTLTTLLLSILSMAMAQDSKVKDELNMQSKILKMDRKYAR